MLASRLLRGSGVERLYVDDVFSAYTRTGTGADVTVTTGIDMTKGYMLWLKGRSGATDHAIYDSARGVTLDLVSNTAAAQTTQATGLKAVSATGHTVGSLAKMNTSAATYVDFVFRKAPKFFDVVTYTGDGTSNKVIAHALGAVPGCVIVKDTTATNNWVVWHRSMGVLGTLYLNTTDSGSYAEFVGDATEASFAAKNSIVTNATGNTYVAYIFAHDTSTDGLIQCGSFTTDASGNSSVNLGWEPQFLLVKNSAFTTDWKLVDISRGLPATGVTGIGKQLMPNTSSTEQTNNVFYVNATGFSVVGSEASNTHIYLAIRRPNKPPTLGTQVYNAIARTGTGAAATVMGVGFAPDLVMSGTRSSAYGNGWQDRLRGAGKNLTTGGNTVPDSGASAEVAYTTTVTAFNMTGISLGVDSSTLTWNLSGTTYINHFFKRAPGVFDVVCYTGTGSAHSEAHNLGVVPELLIVKGRNLADSWSVYNAPRGNTKYLSLHVNYAEGTDSRFWNNTTPTASVFTVGIESSVNASGYTYVAYLFATKPGISKVGSYSGNGGTQTINCGFTTGARFVLIKRTDATGDWFLWDTSRGIVAGNDPHLSLNTTAAEVTTDDSIDPDTSGFIVNQLAATNINATSATYIFLAFA